MGEKRIVLGIHQQGRNGDLVDELYAAGSIIIVISISEAVQRRSVAVVKLPERLYPVVALITTPLWHEAHFCFYLFMKHASESFHVDLI